MSSSGADVSQDSILSPGTHSRIFENEQNETVYLSNNWQLYWECCSLLYPNAPCRLASPCRNGGVKSQDGARCICKPGWRGSSCLVPCAAGFYGQGCSRRCKCGRGAECDPMSGVCSCLDRDRCESRCRWNFWGTSCQHRCNCKTGCQCDADTGECICRSRSPRNRVSSPANMYLATLTQAGFLNVCGGECMNGGTCRTSGVCRCRNGFIGTFCENTCPEGSYGRNCQETCQCSSTAECLPESGLCMCPGYAASQSGGYDDSDEDESDSEYDEDSSDSELMNHVSSSYSMYHCTGRCPVGKYGPYCMQTCNCPAGLLCNDVSGNCECPEGEVCDGSGGTTTQRNPVVTSPPKRRLPVTSSPAAANPANPANPGRGSSGTAPAASGPRTGTGTASGSSSWSSSSSSSHSVSATGSKYPAADPNDGTGTSKAAKPEIALQGDNTATSEERLGRGETLTLWAVIAVSSLLLLVVASVLIAILIKRQHRGSTVHVEGSHKKRLEDTNVYEIVESTNGPYRSNSKTIDKLAKKARERAESFKAQESISSITKEIYLLRTSSLSNMSTLNVPRKDHKATELFANWANSLRLNKSTNSLNEGSSSPGSSRSRSSSNTVTKPYATKTVPLDNDFDDYAEPVDHVSTLSKDFQPKRPLTMTNSDSRSSDRGYQSMYTSSGSNSSSDRTSAVYKPTEDSDYDELEEEVVDQEKIKHFRLTRSYTYSAPSKDQNGEYSCLNRGLNTNNRRGPDDKRKTSRGNTGYCSAVKTAETDGEYSHLNRSAKRLTHIPTRRIQAPTLRHDDEDDYDYLEANKPEPNTTKGNGNVHKKSDGKVDTRKNLPGDGGYDLLNRPFRANNDQYESIWPGKK
ncbi:protein draper-like [Lytechinus pictus]|uniref:protein draper-like n=1 Tax=Lytechinus pictus TaxID=7653 RepID=UPI0030B9EB2E